jgi:hypothetical protein
MDEEFTRTAFEKYLTANHGAIKVRVAAGTLAIYELK